MGTRDKQEYMSLILKPKYLNQDRLVVGVPMTGVVRSEWMLTRYGQVIPCNWSQSDLIQWMNQYSPLNYTVPDARNVIVQKFLESKADWLFFIDSDVLLPPDCFVKINGYMNSAKYPVVAGLYFAKCHPPEPLIYRGRGNSHFNGWKIGDKVWADGIPMGCTLIHRSILELMHRDAPNYVAGGNVNAKQVFDFPSGIINDPQLGMRCYSGTEDLAWCNRVIAGGYLKKAGWTEVAKKRHPFLVDTSIVCKHITMQGQVYPLTMEPWTREPRRTARQARSHA